MSRLDDYAIYQRDGGGLSMSQWMEEEEKFSDPLPGEPVLWASQIKPVREYFRRIGASPRGATRGVISFQGDIYEGEYFSIILKRDRRDWRVELLQVSAGQQFVMEAGDEDYERIAPTEDERKKINAACKKSRWAAHTPVPLAEFKDGLSDEHKQKYEDGLIFPATNIRGEVEFYQVKDPLALTSSKKYKSLWPTDHPRRKWSWGEPPGHLALFNGHLLAGPVVRPLVLTEGAMACRIQEAVERVRRGEPDGWLDAHPHKAWMVEHDFLGWGGGAQKPHRPDLSPLRGLAVPPIVAADNDPDGVQAAQAIANRIGGTVPILQFTGAFPEHFDLADQWPVHGPRPDDLAEQHDAGPGDRPNFARSDRGVVLKTSRNMEDALRWLGIELSCDLFAGREIIKDSRGVLPNDGHTSAKRRTETRFLTDNDMRAVARLIDRDLFWAVELGWAKETMIAEAQARGFHPVLDYLNGLSWDGSPRLDTFFRDYMGAEDTELNKEYGANTLIAAVRRIREPGSKFDQTIVLVGAEGTGKSTAIRVLAVRDEWFTDDYDINDDPREAIEQTRGKWLVEQAEMKSVRSRDGSHIKRALSKQKDIGRLAYDRLVTEHQRTFTLWSTVNPEDKQVLSVLSVNRRFWPVNVGKVDLDALRRDRDQLWAEAAVREAAGEKTVLSEHLWAASREMTAGLHQEIPFLDTLAAALPDQGRVLVECVRVFLGIDEKEFTPNQRMGQAMKALGWENRRMRKGGAKYSYYCKDYEDGPDVTISKSEVIDPVYMVPGEGHNENVVGFPGKQM